MGAGAQLTVTDMRRATRHPVDHKVIGEHRRLGDVHIHIVNISAHGFMANGPLDLSRGERVVIRLPEVGRPLGLSVRANHPARRFHADDRHPAT